MVWLVKIKSLLAKIPFLIKLFNFFGKVVSLVTPQGLHLMYKRLTTGKCDVVVDNISITDDDDSGFTANIKIKVRSKSKEALTTIKAEIENRPLTTINK